MKKILTILMATILALSLASALADELTVESNVLFITLTDAPAEETEAPAEETEAPVEETEAPAEETEVPAEETEAPAEETEAPAEEAEAEQLEAPEPLEVTLTYTCEYEAPYYFGDEIALLATTEAEDAVYAWEISLDGGASWEAVPEADGAALTVELNADNADALWRVSVSTETAAGVSGPVGGFNATEYIPDSIAITLTSEAEAPYAYGDVLHFHADYFTLSENPVVVWETSSDGESWTEIADAQGSDLTLIVSEATDGLQVRAKLLTDDTVE